MIGAGCTGTTHFEYDVLDAHLSEASLSAQDQQAAAEIIREKVYDSNQRKELLLKLAQRKDLAKHTRYYLIEHLNELYSTLDRDGGREALEKD